MGLEVVGLHNLWQLGHCYIVKFLSGAFVLKVTVLWALLSINEHLKSCDESSFETVTHVIDCWTILDGANNFLTSLLLESYIVYTYLNKYNTDIFLYFQFQSYISKYDCKPI